MTDSVFRPIITIVRKRMDDTLIEVTLDDEGRLASGEAQVTDDDELAAAAEAACAAVTTMAPSGATVSLAWVVEHAAVPELDRSGYVTAAVTVTDQLRTERLLGTAFVRTDALVASVRAVLDALPRRLAQVIAQNQPVTPDGDAATDFSELDG
ncbi:hypothetical protein [Euzebya tangerina]|uniref:hypothetical protein n=1 Tax=Euzebya tangerina TaxID=591198 RepID=UPI000E30C12D|nr:hypothetical protein [Euzebya tangerina]